jgi:hypothetical protein
MTTLHQKAEDEKRLWEIAKLRAAFKQHLAVYFVVNSFLVLVWLFTTGWRMGGYFWPIWPILGWGLAVALQYMRAYHAFDLFNTEAEYRRLKDQSDRMQG